MSQTVEYRTPIADFKVEGYLMSAIAALKLADPALRIDTDVRGNISIMGMINGRYAHARLMKREGEYVPMITDYSEHGKELVDMVGVHYKHATINQILTKHRYTYTHTVMERGVRIAARSY
jgi:hypothetical protein